MVVAGKEKLLNFPQYRFRDGRLSIFLPRFLNSLAQAMGRAVSEACLLCGSATREGNPCPACRETLPLLPCPRCPVCAAPAPQASACGDCLRRPPAFDAAAVLLEYRFPVDAMIRRFKYQGDLAGGRALGRLLAEHVVPLPSPDLLIPMPLHPARLKVRGFNQAAELAREIARKTHTSVVMDLCARHRDTAEQAGLSRRERRRNVRGAFTCVRDLDGADVVVVDDVLTTGATLNELARVLKRRGAARVRAWVVARAVPD
jgi:ComF family protein